jgi:hypothetical protein
MKKGRRAKTSRFLHKYLGLVSSLLFVFWVVSGIVLNHRQTFSSIDVGRDNLPSGYVYNNWNLASLKGGIDIGGDSCCFFKFG